MRGNKSNEECNTSDVGAGYNKEFNIEPELGQ